MNTDEKLDLLLNKLDDIPTKIDLAKYIKDSGLETDRKIAELSDKYSKNLSDIVRAISIYNAPVSFKTMVNMGTNMGTDCHTTSEHGSNESVESNGSIGFSLEDLDDVEEVKSSIIDKSDLAVKKSSKTSDEQYQRYKMCDFGSLVSRSTYVLYDGEDLNLFNEDVQGDSSACRRTKI